jgi:hypothetical protein
MGPDVADFAKEEPPRMIVIAAAQRPKQTIVDKAVLNAASRFGPSNSLERNPAVATLGCKKKPNPELKWYEQNVRTEPISHEKLWISWKGSRQ